MGKVMSKIKRDFQNELPLIRIYAALYLIGIIVGVVVAIALRADLMPDARSIYSSENTYGLWSSFLKEFFCFLLLFFLGLMIIGAPILPLYPLYKGFSIGLLISLAVILTGVRGLFFGTLAFFAQNALYSVLGYFICSSSARLSVALFESFRNSGKHIAAHREVLRHIVRFLCLIPFLFLGALWESEIVPFFLHLI